MPKAKTRPKNAKKKAAARPARKSASAKSTVVKKIAAPAPRTPERAGAPPSSGFRGTDPKRVTAILEKLDEAYPQATCALVHKDAFQLLIATILSAQSTDATVNTVTPELFKKYPTPAALAHANPAEVEKEIRSTGFFRNKTKSIIGASKKIVEDFGGEVPKTMEQLLTLPGVARKTANVVLGTAFGIADGVVVDTHVQRLSQRLDLTRHSDPKKIEQDLMTCVPRDKWILFAHQLIWHGRKVCQARKPRCIDCNLEKLCYSKDKTV
jgi:endonuclease III